MKKILLFFIIFSSINLYSNEDSIASTPLSSTFIVKNISCQGSNDGTISLTTTGGQAPYIYSLNGATFPINTAPNFTNLAAGNYTIITTDALGTSVTYSISILEPTLLLATTLLTKPIDCISNASVTVTATGGTAPYSYSRNNGVTFVSTNILDNLTAGINTITVKDSNGCIVITTFIIEPLKPLIMTATATDISCKGSNTGVITVLPIGGQAPYTYSMGNGFEASNVFANLIPGTYNVIIRDALNCTAMLFVTITEPATPLSATQEIKDQTITINATGGTGIIKYAISPNLNTFTTNNTFTNLTPGIYQVLVQDEKGCTITINGTISPAAPLVDGKNAIVLNITTGQTLGDLKIPGTDIKWYSNSTSVSGKSSKSNETALPLSTVIVDNTTYYASQTINGIESTGRLAVTAKLVALGINDYVIKDFMYYPNPVKKDLIISNTYTIDEITLISINGATILTKKINALQSEIDLSNISKGIYFLKVKSEGAEKTVKLIKE